MADEIVTHKTCRICGETKPAEQFHLQAKILKSGNRFRVNRCMACTSAYKKARWIPKPKKDTRKPIPADRPCVLCGVTKPSSEFSRKKAKGKGDNGETRFFPVSRCKQCWNERLRIKRPRKQGRFASPIDQPKKCSICGEIKGPDQFLITQPSGYVARLRSECNSCRSETVKKWKPGNPEAARIMGIAGTHNRRVKVKALVPPPRWSDYERAVAETLADYRIGDQYWDVYDSCLIDKPSVDHLVAIDKGGNNNADNLTVTSVRNNCSKGNKSLIVWLAKRAARTRSQQSQPSSYSRQRFSPSQPPSPPQPWPRP